MCYFPLPSWDDDPIWRTHIFQGGWNHQLVFFGRWIIATLGGLNWSFDFWIVSKSPPFFVSGAEGYEKGTTESRDLKYEILGIWRTKSGQRSQTSQRPHSKYWLLKGIIPSMAYSRKEAYFHFRKKVHRSPLSEGWPQYGWIHSISPFNFWEVVIPNGLNLSK
jgi:hypothetical protein